MDGVIWCVGEQEKGFQEQRRICMIMTFMYFGKKGMGGQSGDERTS